MSKKAKWDLMAYNHKIHSNHYAKCEKCDDSEIMYCIVCGEHKYWMTFCYCCGDVVCAKCCPIGLPIHNTNFVAKEKF